MDASGFTYELLFVDDKSTDNTLARLEEIAPRLPADDGSSPSAATAGRAPPAGSARSAARGRHRRLDRRRHDLPQRAHPGVRPVPAREGPEVDQVVGARTSEQGTHKSSGCPPSGRSARSPRSLTATKIPDLNSGLRAFRREVSLPYLRLLPPGFSCVTTITMSFLSNQHAVDYLPIDYAKRAGKCKFHFFRDAYRYILQVLRMVMYFNPIKVLMPLALTLLGVGIVKGIVDVVALHGADHHEHGADLRHGLIIGAIALLADLIVRSRGRCDGAGAEQGVQPLVQGGQPPRRRGSALRPLAGAARRRQVASGPGRRPAVAAPRARRRRRRGCTARRRRRMRRWGGVSQVTIAHPAAAPWKTLFGTTRWAFSLVPKIPRQTSCSATSAGSPPRAPSPARSPPCCPPPRTWSRPRLGRARSS